LLKLNLTMGSICSTPNKTKDSSDVEIPSKINFARIFKKVAEREREAQQKDGYFDLKTEDKVWMFSDVSYIDITLKTK